MGRVSSGESVDGTEESSCGSSREIKERFMVLRDLVDVDLRLKSVSLVSVAVGRGLLDVSVSSSSKDAIMRALGFRLAKFADFMVESGDDDGDVRVLVEQVRMRVKIATQKIQHFNSGFCQGQE